MLSGLFIDIFLVFHMDKLVMSNSIASIDIDLIVYQSNFNADLFSLFHLAE